MSEYCGISAAKFVKIIRMKYFCMNIMFFYKKSTPEKVLPRRLTGIPIEKFKGLNNN